MQLDTKEVEIDGVPYRLGKVPAGTAWSMALWIKEVSGSAQAAMGKTIDVESSMTKIGVVSALGGAEAYLAKAMRDPAFVAGVVKPLLGQCMRLNADPPCAVSLDGPNAIYYGNRMSELLRLYQAAVDFNFGPFFQAFSDPAGSQSAAVTTTDGETVGA